jgi:hypothetical protein
MIIIVYRSAGTVPVLLSHFNATSIYPTDFRKILKYQISWKSSSGSGDFPCGGRTDGQTDMTKLIVAFHKFSKAPEKWCGCDAHLWFLMLWRANLQSADLLVTRGLRMVRYIEQVSSVWCLCKVVFLITTRITENFVQKQFNKNFSPSKYYRKWEVKNWLRPNTDKWRRDAAQETRNYISWQHKNTLKADIAILKTDNI